MSPYTTTTLQIQSGLVRVSPRSAEAHHDFDAEGISVFVTGDTARVFWQSRRRLPKGARPLLNELFRTTALNRSWFFDAYEGIVNEIPAGKLKMVCSTISALVGVRP